MLKQPICVSLEQGSEEWKKFRSLSIGASDAPTIMCTNPYKTPLQLWEEKVFERTVKENEAMKRGTHLEPYARAWCEERLGIMLSPAVYKHAFVEGMHASLDGISSCGSVAVEIKCPGTRSHEETKSSKIVPIHYRFQLYHIMEVMNLEEMYFCSYVDDEDAVLLKFKRDDVLIEAMLLAEKEFYQCMKEMKEPELTDRDYVDLSHDDILDMDFKNLEEIRKKIKNLEGLEEFLKSRIIQRADGRNIKCGSHKLTKYRTKGLIQYKDIPELKGINLEIYRSPSRTQWRIS